MKTLEGRTKRIYRFRCDRCNSKFEITEEEKMDIDWEFSDDEQKKWSLEDPKYRPSNYPWKFNCPICKRVRTVHDVSAIDVMDNGKEVIVYANGRM